MRNFVIVRVECGRCVSNCPVKDATKGTANPAGVVGQPILRPSLLYKKSIRNDACAQADRNYWGTHIHVAIS